jgi:NAD(P)-dependent dehydrogenase (short-subunit alcohol dehydrogenase family)
MKKVIVGTGSSSGFGRMGANALALAGHTVFASMRETTRRNVAHVTSVEAFARDNQVWSTGPPKASPLSNWPSCTMSMS